MSTQPHNQSVRITKTYVDSIKPPAHGQTFHRDRELRGFAVRVTAKGAKAFVLEKRVHGKVRRYTLGRYPDLTVEEARKAALQLLGQIASGIDPRAEAEQARVRGITLTEAFADFRKARKNLKPKTLYDYERFVLVAFKDWQERRLVDINREMVQRRHAKLGSERGPAYANLAMRFLRALFNFAIARYEDAQGQSLIADNPVARLTRTRAWYRVERRRRVIKMHELPAWFAAVQALRQRADQPDAAGRPSQDALVGDYLLLCLFTGLRREEAASLRWEQVDLADRTLVLPDPKNREPLLLPLPDYVVTLLRTRQAVSDSRFVFPGSGRRGHLVEPRKSMARVIQASGVEFTLHDLRRTFITVAESLDLPYYAIKRLVNHTLSGDVTAGYIISDVERLRAPMQRICDHLLSVVGERAANVVALAPAPPTHEEDAADAR